MISGLDNRWHNLVWQQDSSELPYLKRSLVKLLRISSTVLRDISGGMLTLRAMSLVYTTLLSLVPLLAVSFSVLKGFGVHNQIEPMLLNLLQPLGEKSVEVTEKIVGFVENMKIGVLGALGLGMLMYTVISLIQKIETAFNFTWRLSATRNLSQRFSNYLSVVMVGPVLIFSAIGITASLKSNTILEFIENLPFGGDLIQLVGLVIPYLLIIGAFTFVYILVPNTRVKIKSALYGAIIAGILWRLTGTMFASFAGGSTSYTAIYSGFAILLLFMIWLYIGWMILLIGASIAYYHQHPESLRFRSNNPTLSAEMREQLALQLMLTIGRAHAESTLGKTTTASLSEQLRMPGTLVRTMLDQLVEGGLLVQLNKPDNAYLPARSNENVRLIDIFQCARRAFDHNLSDHCEIEPVVRQVQQESQDCLVKHLDQRTLQDLIKQESSL